MNASPARTQRWLASLAVLANIFFNYWSNAHPLNGKTIGDVSNQYPTLFTPAGYAFSIWGLIYLSLLLYAIYQLWPSQRSVGIYDQLASPLILTSVLSVLWIIAFSYEWLGSSVLLIVGMLLTALLLFVRARNWTQHAGGGSWLAVPFSLYAGWLTVATIAATATALYAKGWRGAPLSESVWAVLLIAVATGIGLFISWRFRDWIYPLVIAWASVAIWVARRHDHPMVAYVAFTAAGVLLIGALIVGTRQTPWPRSQPA